jgi:putative transposase
MIDTDHPRLSIVRQCKLVGICRSSHYYVPKGESAGNVQLMRLIDAQYLSTPVVWSTADGPSPATSGPRRAA